MYSQKLVLGGFQLFEKRFESYFFPGDPYPGHRVALQSCLEHVEEALDSVSPRDTTTILAALAVRLH